MFNEEHFAERHGALIELLRENAVDVVCLQEVLTPMVQVLITALGDIYTPVLYELQPAGRQYGELIFVSKDIQVLSYQCISLDGKMGRALQHTELQKDGVSYNVATFHLESMNCQKVRREQLKKIWSHCDSLSNVICVGDTNQTAKEQCVIPSNYLDAWEQTNGEIGEYTYYSGRFWDGDRKQRYDKVWFSNDLELLGFGVLGNKPVVDGVWISDHDGLYCLLKPKE